MERAELIGRLRQIASRIDKYSHEASDLAWSYDAEVENIDPETIKKCFERISNFSQEALEMIKLHTGKTKIAEHQHFSPRETEVVYDCITGG